MKIGLIGAGQFLIGKVYHGRFGKSFLLVDSDRMQNVHGYAISISNHSEIQ